jgi:excisionase family DNA binding protein
VPEFEFDTWLSLAEAAQQLGVHPTTLRRWSDLGRISHSRTPGGHRRFDPSDIQSFLQESRRLRAMGGLQDRLAGQALEQTRREIQHHRSQGGWLPLIPESEREVYRSLGRHLLGLTMQFIGMREGGESLLKEAQRIGLTYAEKSVALGITLRETLETLIRIRDTMVDSALGMPESSLLQPEANQHIFRRLSAVFNAVQLAVIEHYQHIITTDTQDPD